MKRSSRVGGVFALTLFAAGALQAQSSGGVPAERNDADTAVSWDARPGSITFDALSRSELDGQLSLARANNRRCVSAGYLPSQYPQGLPFMLFVGSSSGGVVKLNGRLRYAWAGGAGVNVWSLQPVQSFLEDTRSGLKSVFLSLRAKTWSVTDRRASCRVANGSCRVYRASLSALWKDPDRAHYIDGRPRQAPANPPALDVIFEDPCPAGRDGIFEFYASRLEVLEWWHRIWN